MGRTDREAAKAAAEHILKDFGILTMEDYENLEEVDGAVLYENLKAGVLEEFDVEEDELWEILEEIVPEE